MAIMPKDGEPRAEKQSALAEPLGRSTGSGRRAPERVRKEPGRRRSRDSGRGRPLVSDPGKGEGRNERQTENERNSTPGLQGTTQRAGKILFGRGKAREKSDSSPRQRPID